MCQNNLQTPLSESWYECSRLLSSAVLLPRKQTLEYRIVLSVIVCCCWRTLPKHVCYKLWQQLLCYSGSQVPAGTISAALARAPVGPASNFTPAPSRAPASTFAPAPAPLSPGNLSPQPGTLGPVPFHVSTNLILSFILVSWPTVIRSVAKFLSIL